MYENLFRLGLDFFLEAVLVEGTLWLPTGDKLWKFWIEGGLE